MTTPLITLTTDYGTGDHLVGTLKGVIQKICPGATVVDICHEVMAYDVLDGALTIGQAYSYFPPRTVHLVVVDPGVGTQRRPILAAGENQFFVAPDNGVLSLVYEKEERMTVRHVMAEHYFLHPVSNTFHGRDIFAPTAAWLAKTGLPQSFGEEIADFTRFAFPKPKIAEGKWKGVVLRVDRFGNLMTNFSAETAPDLLKEGAKFSLTVGGKQVTKLAQTFAQGEPGEAFAVMGSSGYLEISVNKGSAARVLGAQRGAEVSLEMGGG